MTLKEIIRPLFCHHTLRFVQNIYGDKLINELGGNIVYRCIKCGAIKFKTRLTP